ncbi:hypothetical protein ACLBOM_31265 [Escherichia coli]
MSACDNDLSTYANSTCQTSNYPKEVFVVKNLEYMKGMLEVFLKAKTPFISTKDLANAGYDICSNEGMFHYLLLIEQGYMSNKDLITDDITKLGYMRHCGHMLDMGTDVRLSAQGQIRPGIK